MRITVFFVGEVHDDGFNASALDGALRAQDAGIAEISVIDGVFTHGHVGPEVFPELLRVARPGALFVCGVIPPVFDGAGFGSRLALFTAHGMITPVSFHDIPIYENADHDHAQDRGLVMVFRTL